MAKTLVAYFSHAGQNYSHGSIRNLSVENIPANVKHWHGAAADSWFSHLAIEIEGEETSNEWCESVAEEDYLKIQ